MMLRLAASTAAFLALAQPALAQSGQCLASKDIADTVTYAMPLFMQGLRSACAESLPSDSFILAQGDAFSQRFEPLRDDAWPGARRVLMQFVQRESAPSGGDESDASGNAATAGVVSLIGSLEGEELRPFIDALAMQLIAQQAKPETCAQIEAVLPLLAPLPAENHGRLAATLAEMMAKGEENSPFCLAPAP